MALILWPSKHLSLFKAPWKWWVYRSSRYPHCSPQEIAHSWKWWRLACAALHTIFWPLHMLGSCWVLSSMNRHNPLFTHLFMTTASQFFLCALDTGWGRWDPHTASLPVPARSDLYDLSRWDLPKPGLWRPIKTHFKPWKKDSLYARCGPWLTVRDGVGQYHLVCKTITFGVASSVSARFCKSK